ISGGMTATSTRSGGNWIVGIPGTNPSASPPRTRRIGYGIRTTGEATSIAASATRSAKRTSCSCVPKCTSRAYAAHRLLRMCGICGIAVADGRADLDRLAAMSATLVHRGPDSFGEYVDGPVAIAARRLSIIDLETGDQPIGNEDGTVHVVQNGEIYNYRELRHDLERGGHRFRTHGDTEVLLHLYEEHGDAFAERLRGMFAIALWDARRRRLVLARDRFGIKPLYYRAVGGELAFASELRALPRGEIDLDALEAFLAFNSVPAPFTIFRECRKLPSGHVLAWEAGEIALRRFARPAPVPADEIRGEDDAELAEALRARLRDSVRAHLGSDVPVGVLLSGGIDSSVLAALAADESSEPLRSSTAKASFDYRAKRFVRAAHLTPLGRHHVWKEIFAQAEGGELTERR